MAESLPSAKTIIADVPEVRNFQTKFHYNFFQPDERSNESGRATEEFIRKRSSESFDADFQESDQFNRFTARFVSLSWQPVVEQQDFAPVGFKIADNFEKIHEEQHFLGDTFSNLGFQDLNVDQRLGYFVKKLAREIVDSNQADSSIKNASPTDIVKKVLPNISSEISPAILCQALVNPEDEGVIFKDKEGNKISNPNLLEELKNVKFFAQAYNKNLVALLKTIPENSLSLFEDEVEEYIDEVQVIQDKALSEQDPNFLDGKDYDLEIQEFIDYQTVDADGYDPRFQIMGYLIEKVEIAADGTSVVKSPIIVESPAINTAVDVKIKYGFTYKYMIRSVALFETIATDSVSEQNVVVKYLVASKPTLRTVDCVERVPPPEPADFNVRWDARGQHAVLEWSFPVNTQRDIKGWQIFRRSSINEPFELLKVYDFNDSTIKSKDPQADNPDPFLTKTMTGPQNFYRDLDFKKDSRFIYAVCSVDARGLSSNYSMQFEISFDRFRNQLVKRLVSLKGAPKVYPNFFLRNDVFVDTIRDSGHKKLRIVFNPEYLNVVDSDLNNLGLLKTQNDDKYQVSMINVDLQLQENIQVKLLDKIKSLKKNTNIRKRRLLQNRTDKFDRLNKDLGRRKK